MSETEFHFPKRFLWGASVSAHQVEGGNKNNWTVWEFDHAKVLAKQASYRLNELPRWKETRKESTKPGNYVSGQAVDHYNRYELDFDIAKKLGLNAFRFSIEWSRIEPEDGVWDEKELGHYRSYVRAMQKRGLEPIMTLYHWTEPLWFTKKGGFEKGSNVRYFTRFAEKVLTEFQHDVRYVVTMNEPDTRAGHGYMTQQFPPGKASVFKMIQVYKNQLKAHKKVYAVAHGISRRYKVSFVKQYAWRVLEDRKVSTRLMSWLVTLVVDRLPLRYVGKKQDFLGVNYYFTDFVQGFHLHSGEQCDEKRDAHASDVGWSLYPENLERVLLSLKRYKLPIVILETGVADAEDTYRKDWLNATIRSVNTALKSGVDVFGYMHWSLLDNFEWQYGKFPRFGLVEVDYKNGLKRTVRPSGLYYGAFVRKMRGAGK